MTSVTTTTTAGVGGSVRWMATELLAPKSTMDAGKHTTQTDVWAYGMVLYVSAAWNIAHTVSVLRASWSL